jgi:hypothetical protein
VDGTLMAKAKAEKFSEHLTAIDEAWDNQVRFASSR